MERTLNKRERQRYDNERNSTRSYNETRHLFIGGWENFDMDFFLKGRSKKAKEIEL